MQTIHLDLIGKNVDEQSREECLAELIQLAKKYSFETADIGGEDDPFINFDMPVLGDNQPTGEDIITYSATVGDAWIDYNGHMTESAYTYISGYAYDAFARYVGVDEEYRKTGFSFYTVENHGLYMRECKKGDEIYITTRVLGADVKRMHLFHSYFLKATDECIFTIDQMMLHTDMNEGKVAPIREDVFKRIMAIKSAQDKNEIPELSSRAIKMKDK